MYIHVFQLCAHAFCIHAQKFYIYIILREYVNNIHFHFCYYKKLIFNQKHYFNLFMLLETQGYFNAY